MTLTAQTYIDSLQMEAHPEGGFFKETYRSHHLMDVTQGSATTTIQRSVSTGIYFLLEKNNFSAFHKIKSDEMWHFYAGQALEVVELNELGELDCTRLGPTARHIERRNPSTCSSGQYLVCVQGGYRWFVFARWLYRGTRL